jgi:cyclophilin family peptidyl-prolyl cis-trans isomerase
VELKTAKSASLTMRHSMQYLRLLITLLVLCSANVFAQATQDPSTVAAIVKPILVALHTNRGEITLELYPDKAPLTVANFIAYAKSGFYDGTIFHRVIKDFMIQGGGFNENMQEKRTRDPILNESNNGLNNLRWTVAMARMNNPDSAAAQFFINLKMNTILDYENGKEGYTVFGKVIDGQYVVKSISLVPTETKNGNEDVPEENIVIEHVEIKS